MVIFDTTKLLRCITSVSSPLFFDFGQMDILCFRNYLIAEGGMPVSEELD